MNKLLLFLSFLPFTIFGQVETISLEKIENKEKEVIKKYSDLRMPTLPLPKDTQNRLILSTVYYPNHTTISSGAGITDNYKLGMGITYLRKNTFELDGIQLNSGFTLFPNSGVYFDLTLDTLDHGFTAGWKIGMIDETIEACNPDCNYKTTKDLDLGFQGGYRIPENNLLIYGHFLFSGGYAIGLGLDF